MGALLAISSCREDLIANGRVTAQTAFVSPLPPDKRLERAGDWLIMSERRPLFVGREHRPRAALHE